MSFWIFVGFKGVTEKKMKNKLVVIGISFVLLFGTFTIESLAKNSSTPSFSALNIKSKRNRKRRRFIIHRNSGKIAPCGLPRRSNHFQPPSSRHLFQTSRRSPLVVIQINSRPAELILMLMKNLLLPIFLLILSSTLSAQNSACTVSGQSITIRGFRLGMTESEATRRYPKIEIYNQNDGNGLSTSNISALGEIFTESERDGLSSVFLWFLDKKLAKIENYLRRIC